MSPYVKIVNDKLIKHIATFVIWVDYCQFPTWSSSTFRDFWILVNFLDLFPSHCRLQKWWMKVYSHYSVYESAIASRLNTDDIVQIILQFIWNRAIYVECPGLHQIQSQYTPRCSEFANLPDLCMSKYVFFSLDICLSWFMYCRLVLTLMTVWLK